MRHCVFSFFVLSVLTVIGCRSDGLSVEESNIPVSVVMINHSPPDTLDEDYPIYGDNFEFRIQNNSDKNLLSGVIHWQAVDAMGRMDQKEIPFSFSGGIRPQSGMDFNAHEVTKFYELFSDELQIKETAKVVRVVFEEDSIQREEE